MTLDELRAQATESEGSFLAWDSMAVELEVAELLYALVRQMKPDLVVECGTGNGYATRFIVEALQANREQRPTIGGWLKTFEQNGYYFGRANESFRDSGLPLSLTFGFSWEEETFHVPDLVFVDSLGDHRDRDIAHWLSISCDDGREGPLLVVHDANGYPGLNGGVRLRAGRGVWIGRA